MTQQKRHLYWIEGQIDEVVLSYNKLSFFSGRQMTHHWQSTLGQSWFLGAGLQHGASFSDAAPDISLFDSDGDVNALAVERYRRQTQAGGWWFGGRQRFPRMPGVCES